MYIKTTALLKIAGLKKRIRVVTGGTSASKTISIIMWLIDYAQCHDNQTISIVSETMPHLKRGAIRDFENIMRDRGYFKEDKWNRTDFIYRFETGTIIEFFSADQADRVRGPRRDVLFINEANNVALETFTQLEIRTRRIVWIDYNPVAEFWFYTDVKPFVDHDFLTVTYLDNEALTRQEVEALEVYKNNPNRANWWKVYGEGQLGEATGRIYTNWNVIDALPREARLEGYGLDFGYTIDPTAIVALYRYNGAPILEEVAYNKGMSNRAIADLLLNLPPALIIADSSEPKSIDELSSYLKAYTNIVGATKGAGSVSQGIQYVQDQPISITKASVNILKEYRNYLWMTDPRTSKNLNEPIGGNDHAMDAVRYAFSKNFVKMLPRVAYNPPNAEALKAQGVATPYGGFEGYQGMPGFGSGLHN